MQALAYHGLLFSPSPSTSSPHARSQSLDRPSASALRSTLTKTRSASALRTMATADEAAESSQNPPLTAVDSSFNTLPDPRPPSQADGPESPATVSKHPDMSSEVAALNDKLINAINHQTSLDDTLAQTRHDLELSKARIAQLEADIKARELELAEERKQKSMAQQEKRGMESELESLTASLFDEANQMVAAANRDRAAFEKKNQQLRDQIKDGETIIASQSEQLTELKALMHTAGPDAQKDESVSVAGPAEPSSPGLSREDTSLARLLEAMNLTPVSPEHADICPAPSTSFTHLLKPICRADIPAFEEFHTLTQTAVRSHQTSRAGSGSYGNLIGVSGTPSANGSSTSLNAITSMIPQSPTIPGSFTSNPDGRGPTSLKETRFFKRIMVEDVEPTLRLDLSPTISWLNRRTILNALTDSSLIVEPIPEASRQHYGKYTACSLCGESRREEQNPRTHHMRVNEGENATKWPLCRLCLEKVRSVGDLVSYIRLVRDGVVKCGDKTEQLEAWEELVRLRERLFWARMAAGVVPKFIESVKNSPVVDGNAAQGPFDAKPDTGEEAAVEVSGTDEPRKHSSSSGESAESSQSQLEATRQLQAGLDEALTTFEGLRLRDRDGAHRRVMSGPAAPGISGPPSGTTTPPSSPPVPPLPSGRRFGGAGRLSRISIPNLPSGFWGGQVNVLR